MRDAAALPTVLSHLSMKVYLIQKVTCAKINKNMAV